jgi:hypothetical protein
MIVVTLFAVSAVGCGSKDCADTIKQSVPVGSTMTAAMAALMQCGFTVQIDTKANILNGTKAENGLIIKRVDVAIQLNGNDQVSSVETKNHFTGP